MHAIILAGGFGTRLKSAVADVPKPLAPIQGKPFLAWLIEWLAGQGVTSVMLSVHYDWKKIRDYFTANPAQVPIEYAVEKAPLGTGGAMVYALENYYSDAPVLVMNGDSFVRVDIGKLVAQHQAKEARLSMVLRALPDAGRYGNVVEENGIITAFSDGVNGQPGLINAGVYVMTPKLFADDTLAESFSFEKDYLPHRLESIQPQSFHAEDYFIDIGIPEDYVRAQKELPQQMGLAK